MDMTPDEHIGVLAALIGFIIVLLAEWIYISLIIMDIGRLWSALRELLDLLDIKLKTDYKGLQK